MGPRPAQNLRLDADESVDLVRPGRHGGATPLHGRSGGSSCQVTIVAAGEPRKWRSRMSVMGS